MRTQVSEATQSTMKLARKVMSRTRLLRANVRNTRRYEIIVRSSSKSAISLQPTVECKATGRDKEQHPAGLDQQPARKLSPLDLAKEDRHRKIRQIGQR